VENKVVAKLNIKIKQDVLKMREKAILAKMEDSEDSFWDEYSSGESDSEFQASLKSLKP